MKCIAPDGSQVAQYIAPYELREKIITQENALIAKASVRSKPTPNDM